MALKACSYRNCQNYVLDHVPSGSFTLFQFPKNVERRKKWMELGQAPKNLPQSAYYYCSDHFDRKFMAVNQRRTILVGEAMPFPCMKLASTPIRGDGDGGGASSSNGNANTNHNTTTTTTTHTSIQTIYLSERDNEHCEPYNEYILCDLKEMVREDTPGRSAGGGGEHHHHHDLIDQKTENLQLGSTMNDEDEEEENNLKHTHNNILYDFKLGHELTEDSSSEFQHPIEQRKTYQSQKRPSRQSTITTTTNCSRKRKGGITMKSQNGNTNLMEGKIILLNSSVSNGNSSSIGDQVMHISTPNMSELLLCKDEAGNTTNEMVEEEEETPPQEEEQDDEVFNTDSIGNNNNNSITKFIYKGEEYIQMPLQHYANEKLLLTRKIERLSHILRAIGTQIDIHREENLE